MKIDRKDFLAAIRGVMPAIKGRTTIPILSTIRMTAINGGLRVVASDCEVFLESACCCKGELTPCCVSPGPLVAISGYGPDTMELTLDKGRLRVECGSVASLSVQNAEEYPKWPNESLKELIVNAADLADAIQSVAWAASNKSTEYDLNKRSIWIGMNTKKHALEAGAMDGRRLGYINKPSVVPNASLYLLAEHANLICEVLRGENPSISTNENWIVVRSEKQACAIKQVNQFNFPSDHMMKAKDESSTKGTMPRASMLEALTTISTVANGEFIYPSAGLSKSAIKLDYVGRTSEFHSVVSVDSNGNSKPSQCSTVKPLNVAGVAADTEDQAQSPSVVSFDAALLHNVLKNTPGETLNYSCDGKAIFFDGGGVVSALALIESRPT